MSFRGSGGDGGVPQQHHQPSFWDTTDDPLFGLDDAVQPMPNSISGFVYRELSDPSLVAAAAVDTRQKKRARMLAASTVDGVETGTTSGVRRSKRRVVPECLSGRDMLAAKYPLEVKQAIANCLKVSNLELDIHEQIRGAVRRPALLRLSSYWFVAWQLVRCFVSMWPLICLPRCNALIRQLQAAQQIFMEQFPQMMHEQAIEQQRREQFRLTASAPTSSTVVAKPVVVTTSDRKAIAAASSSATSLIGTASTATTTTQGAATSAENLPSSLSSKTITPTTRSRGGQENVETTASALFLECCGAARTEFVIDNYVQTFVKKEAAAQQGSIKSGKTSGSAAAEHKRLIAYRQTIFECFAMFILAVAERAGDIFLKRSSVNGYIVELQRVKDVFERRAEQAGFSFDAVDVEIGGRFNLPTKEADLAIRLGKTISHNDVRVAHRQILDILPFVK